MKQINYVFQKLARSVELENFLSRVFIIVLFETNTFFDSFDQLKMHQLC